MNLHEIVSALWAGHTPPRPLTGKSPRYSASTVKGADHEKGGCLRKHFFEEVVGIIPALKPAQVAAFATGTKVHGHLERYHKHGTIPRGKFEPGSMAEEALAASALPHIPAHGTPGAHIEESFRMGTWPNGPEFTGTQDLFIEPDGFAQEHFEDYNHDSFDFMELFDYKTTGNYPRYAAAGWALTDKTLPDDLQNIAYSENLFRRFPVKEVRSTWVYLDKSGGPSVPVRATMERQETREKWRSRVLPIVEEMHGQHVGRPALADVPFNEDACDGFGGCPHRSYCVDYKGSKQHKEIAMGKLSDSLIKGHKETKGEKEAKTEKEDKAPAINPPPLKGPNPFMEMKDELKAAREAKTVDERKGKKLAEEVREATKAEPKDEAPKKAQAPSGGAGFALFLGCIPVVSKRPLVPIATILQPLEEKVARENKVGYYGEVKFDSEHLLCAALTEWLEEKGDALDGTNVFVPVQVGPHANVAQRVLFSRATAVAQKVA